jgi:hypothetical protein
VAAACADETKIPAIVIAIPTAPAMSGFVGSGLLI